MPRELQSPALLLACLLGLSPVALAGLSEAELNRLDQDLTPIGAERAGNADGSIPAWSGQWRGAPAHVAFAGSGSLYPDPYADERPLFSITAQNLEQYQDRLSDGQVALFKRYPRSYRMDIYPSHRDFRPSANIEAHIRENGRTAQLSEDGNGVTGAWGGSPFPIPKNGNQLIKNHILQGRGPGEEGIYSLIVTLTNGKQARQVQHHQTFNIWTNPDSHRQNDSDAITGHFMHKTLEPARELGKITFGHGFVNPVANAQQSWQYDPGSRRVRRAPNVGYDNPSSGASGSLRVNDDSRMFNGGTDRYQWTIIGKRELFIPYHNYRINDPAITLAKLTETIGHPNPETLRYELHRVWVLEASLKPGNRHVYAKRRFYIDEDTWGAVIADSYDARNHLWRTNLQTTFYAYDTQSYQPGPSVYHDLISGAYLVDRLTNEHGPIRLAGFTHDAGDFTPAAVRKRAK
ncbi:DUF1329 domain-containing protein [Pseudomonas sp. Au-Pse12]|uniref:DUF1329 domain-containing protein n=1 Tax=Pseudomonas sp. Au-Pse12 TaxID=2906459 RepID=UPI001E637B29|nr:DUF1329 domain-containing protein [Pseudomonas sp. Au-Pse12]MCE4056967.1 DUF1329 domain-containing protein [Pseudomonas sp. Au-Pse12]